MAKRRAEGLPCRPQESRSSGTSPHHSAPDLRHPGGGHGARLWRQHRYDQLVERITGHRPDKTHRFTDWSRRPLTAEQMHYAVSDVTHLRDVFAAPRRRL
jgi:hypothetical protein